VRFILEESSWVWDGADREAYIERIEVLLDRLDVASERGEPYAASRELLEQAVLEGKPLGDLLWVCGSALDLPFEVMQRLTAHFNVIRYWDDEIEWQDFLASIAGREVVSPSASLAHARVAQGSATACLPLPGTWSGPCEVVVGEVKKTVHFVVDEQSHRAFFRDALEVERADEGRLEALAPHAFPDLFFLEGVWRGLNQFEGGYRRVRDDLHRLLSILDDHGAWVFTDKTGRLSREEPDPTDKMPKPVTNQLTERRFKRWGLDMAPEKPDVRADNKCREARERKLGGQPLYCEWHYKFEPHINRAHIHPPVSASGEKLIVAIFCDHLPLPKGG
jgi:hypothetical protein